MPPAIFDNSNIDAVISSEDTAFASPILSYKLFESYSDDIQKKLLQLFNDTALLICEGQQMDMDFENQTDINYESYIKIIKYKTAVLLGSSMQMGAIINNVNEIDSKLLYECGINLGLAFQIQDDYLDLTT